jgi:hypothetical protein
MISGDFTALWWWLPFWILCGIVLVIVATNNATIVLVLFIKRVGFVDGLLYVYVLVIAGIESTF